MAVKVQSTKQGDYFNSLGKSSYNNNNSMFIKQQKKQSQHLRKTIDFSNSKQYMQKIKRNKVLNSDQSKKNLKQMPFYNQLEGQKTKQNVTSIDILDSSSTTIAEPKKKKQQKKLRQWINSLTPLTGKPFKIFPDTMTQKKSQQCNIPCNCKKVHGTNLYCQYGQRWAKAILCKNGQQFQLQKYKEQYQTLVTFKEESQSTDQIKKDLMRTFPKLEYFQDPQGEGIQRLRRILHAFSLYDRGVGYVQGMNFIVGALMMHCSEQIAFWLFISLLEDFELRDTFQPGLPGLYKHCQIIDLLIMEELPKVYKHFCENSIVVQLFATDWIFSMYTSVLPMNKMAIYFTQFFDHGWPFFYKFILASLKYFQQILISGQDIASILSPLKHWDEKGIPSNKSHSAIFQGFNIFKSSKDPFDKILSIAKSWKLDEQHILYLLDNYDSQTKSFKLEGNHKKVV